MRYPASTICQMGLLRIVLESFYALTFQPFRSLKGITGSCRSFMPAIGTPQGSDGADFGLDGFTQKSVKDDFRNYALASSNEICAR